MKTPWVRRLPRALYHINPDFRGFLQEYDINFKDFEPPFLDVFAQVASSYLFKVFIRVKYLGTSKKTDSNMK